MIIKCECKHETQDRINGKQMRVFNKGIKGFKCTVCGKVKDVSTKK